MQGNRLLSRYRFSETILACVLPLIYHPSAHAGEEVTFDSGFLMGSQTSGIDLNQYAKQNPAPAGRFTVKVNVNNEPAGRFPLDFISRGGESAQACLTPALLVRMGIRTPEKSDAEACVDLPAQIPEAHVQYDTGERLLEITVPQIWRNKHYRNYVDPSLWENGVNAALLSWDANVWRSETPGNTSTTYWAGFTTGANLGGWRLRAVGNYSASDEADGEIAFQSRYAQHDLPALRSQLILGETFTTGETFDSVKIRGARLYSDMRMLPPALNNFAPVVRGVAHSNAKVTISQGGYKLYEASVPPGPFAIDEFTPSGYGSDIDVLVTEADGSKNAFSIPYNTGVQMLRPGVARWDVGAGRVDDESVGDKPNVVQGSLYYGINNYFTGYTGAQITESYLALLLGTGMNTPVGALAFDVTHSQTGLPDGSALRGESYRLSYSTLIPETDTSIAMATYRYSTKNYLGLHDALQMIDDAKSNDVQIKNVSRVKNRFNINVNQPLNSTQAHWGSLYANASWYDYWDQGGTNSDYSLGYSNSYNQISYTVNLMRSYDQNGQRDDSISLNVSIPFSLFSRTDEYVRSGFRSLDATAGSDFNGSHQMQLSSSGNNEDGTLSYGVNGGYSMAKQGRDLSNVGGFTSWESPIGTLAGSASVSDNHQRQYSLSTDGGFVLHGGGLTFSNNSFDDTDTLTLVNAPGAEGARISMGSNTIGSNGYGVASSLAPYRENTITLNARPMENDVALLSSSGVVVPRQGAVTLLNFATDEGRSAVINLVRSDALPVPFSAEVYNASGAQIGNIGQGGQAFVRGIEESGTLTVRWGEKTDERCTARYQVPENPVMLNKTLVLNQVICRKE